MTGWAVPLLVGGVMCGGYLLALSRRPGSLPTWSRRRTAAWLVGAAVVVLALSPPVAGHVHHDARHHMAQHLLLGMYAPLLLVLAAPLTLLLGSLPRPAGRRLTGLLRSGPVHVLSSPVVAAVLAVGGAFAVYLTPLEALAADRPEVHALVLVHFLLAGYLYVWALAGPDPAPRRPGLVSRVVVLIGAAGAHAFLAKLLYARAADPGAAGHGDPATVEAAAQLMYYGGDVAEVALAVMLLTGWYRRRSRPPGGTRPGLVAPTRSGDVPRVAAARRVGPDPARAPTRTRETSHTA